MRIPQAKLASRRRIICALCVSFVAGEPLVAQELRPTIAVEELPPAGPGGEQLHRISGRVGGAPAGAVVVIWAKAGDVYWVQPWANAYATRIDADGRFATQTHPGSDYVVAVARSGFTTPMTRRTLPPVGDDILQLTVFKGR